MGNIVSRSIPGSPMASRYRGVIKRIYVDTTVLSTGDGTAMSPFKTLTEAISAWSFGYVITVYAPETTPVRELIIITTTGIEIEAWNLSKWYWFGSNRINPASWVSVGGGIYYTPFSGTGVSQVRSVVCLTQRHLLLDEDDGDIIPLALNRGGVTDPTEGFHSIVGGTNLYIHLLDGENPADHIVEVGKERNATLENAVLILEGNIELSLKDVVIQGGRVNTVSVTNGATLYGENMILRSGDQNVLSTSASGKVIISSSKMLGPRGNDCFNDNGSGVRSVFNNTVFAAGVDEGASGHNGNEIIINGGKIHHCGSFGYNSVMTVYGELNNVDIYMNGLLDNAAGLQFSGATRGRVVNCTTHDNLGEGIIVTTTGEVYLCNPDGWSYNNGATDIYTGSNITYC